MTTPSEERPVAGPQATPEEAAAGVPGTPQVTTAPPRARWRMGKVPSRLGRARTSTVALAVGWLLVALLWLDVRPPSAQIVPTSGTDAGTVAPATTAPARPTTTTTTTHPTSPAPAGTTAGTPTTPAAPSSTSPAPGATSAAPTPTTPSSTSTAPRTSATPGSTPVLPTTGAAPSS